MAGQPSIQDGWAETDGWNPNYDGWTATIWLDMQAHKQMAGQPNLKGWLDSQTLMDGQPSMAGQPSPTEMAGQPSLQDGWTANRNKWLEPKNWTATTLKQKPGQSL